jgi:hypothetical protein
MSATKHLMFIGSDRHGEDYAVIDRASGERLGCTTKLYREWEAYSDDGERAVRSTQTAAALALWPPKTKR